MSSEWDCDAFRPPYLIFFPLADMFAATLLD